MVPTHNSSSTTVNEFAHNSPCNQNQHLLRKHKRLKTHPGASNDKSGLLPEDIIKPSRVKPREGHKKASTVSGQVTRGSQYHSTPMLKKLRETKQMAETAMKVCLFPTSADNTCLNTKEID